MWEGMGHLILGWPHGKWQPWRQISGISLLDPASRVGDGCGR